MSAAVVFPAYGSPDVLEVIDVGEPVAGPGEVRIAMRAAGVQPFDCKLRHGDMDGYVPVTFPQVLGNELAGVIDQVGAEVEGFAVGDEVMAFMFLGAYAEHVVVPADNVVRKPEAL